MQINSTIYNSNQKRNNDKCQCECKNYCMCKKDYCWNPSTCVCKCIVDNSVIVCDEITYVMDIVPTNALINVDDKKGKP